MNARPPSRVEGPDRRDHSSKEDMMAGTKSGSVFDITALFEQELKARNEDLHRRAVLSMLPKLRPSQRMSMAEFLDSLQQHREVWSAVLEMFAVDFAIPINGGPRMEPAKTAPEQAKRTRISDVQKNSLKGTIVNVLGNHKDGLRRTDIAGQMGDDVLATIGVKLNELASKLRQPLGELVDDHKIHTIGEKRLMRYH
jgi:hypothetical protein